jgi:TRAP-type C4-dicarboxylate transport system permease large subunit
MGKILFRSGISENLFKALVPWLNRFPSGLLLINIVACTLFAAVSGSGAATTAAFALYNKRLNGSILMECLLAAVKTTSMIMFNVIGAAFLSRAMGILGIPREITHMIGGMELSPYVLVIMLALVYSILGSILDGFSIVVVTLSIALPLVTLAGFDPIWFGIFLILMVELS